MTTVVQPVLEHGANGLRRSTRAERKGATIGTNIDDEQVVCYAKFLMHGLRKSRHAHHLGRTQPFEVRSINGSSRTTNLPQLSPAIWPRRYLEGMGVSHPHARTLPISLMPLRSFEALAPPSVRQKKKINFASN